MKPLPSQEKLQDPPVPATSAAQNLDLWEHYERTPRDNNIISVYSGIQETLLHVAVKTGSLRMTELLLSHGPSLVSVDSAGRTPLHTASEPSNFKSIDIIKLLIEHGPIHYIDTQTIQSQDTCLHIAAAAQNSALVQYLLEMHVKTHFVNADGHTAEQVARMRLQRVEQKRKAHNQNSSGISQDSFECSRKIVAHFTQARELMQKNMAQKEQLENEKRLKEAIKMELENQEDDKIRRKQEEKLMKEAKKREEEEELLRNLVKSTNSGKRKKNKSKNKSKAITASSSNTVHQENIQVGEQRSSSAHINPEDSANEPTKGSEVIHDKSNVPYDNDNSSHDVGYQSIPVEPFSYQQFIGIHQRIMELHNQSLPTQRTFYQLSSSDQAIPTPTPRPTRAVQHTQRRFSQPMQLQGTQTNQRHAPASGVSPQQNIVMLPTTVNATSTSFSPHRSKMNFSQTTLDNSKVISPPRTTQHLAASSSYVSNESVFTWNAFSPEIWGPPQPQVALVRNIPQQSFATNPVAFDVHTNLPRFSLFD
ncbi:hypothetical protein BGW37DRAFT_190699 [Umbelopsis sp. PMI_123]|nr:hypothetical protein BGW37DRAFT_190699 [Umbelopsis sp. PMI_123]